MLEKFKEILKNDFDNFQGKQLYLAISGGKDSICLSQLLLAAGFSHTLLHCNFQLRGFESDLDEQFLLAYAKKNNLSIHTTKFNTSKISEEQNSSIQQTARKLRYDWFSTFLVSKKDILLTAHHSDDAIETFFINLMRGTSLQGLTGINNQHNIKRPLLSLGVNEIEQYLSLNKIEYRQDQSNFDNKYLRNYLRNQIIPSFQEKSENFKPKVSKTISSLSEVDSWIQKQANNFLQVNFTQSENTISVDKNVLLSQDNIFLTYVLKNFGDHRSNVKNLESALNSNTGSKFLTSTHHFLLNRDEILINELNPTQDFNNNTYSINTFPEKLTLGNSLLEFTILTKPLQFSNNKYQQFDLNKVKLPLTIRHWQHGDRIQPLGMRGTKLISDILIDNKVPQTDKPKILVLVDSQKTIIAIPELLISEKVKIQPNSTSILHLHITSLAIY
mgnify:CR=1 FL=1